jgi:hypothetical protein
LIKQSSLEEAMQTKPESQDPQAAWTQHPHWEYEDPFAEPRTIPTGWDMSEFLKSSETETFINSAESPAPDAKDGLKL